MKFVSYSVDVSKYEVYTTNRSRLTENVQWPEFDGWKYDSVLVMSLSKESSALEPARKPVCEVSSRIGPSRAIE